MGSSERPRPRPWDWSTGRCDRSDEENLQADESAGSWGNSHFFLALLGFQVLKMKMTVMGSMIAKTDATNADL